jgi:hypothetical protein
VPVNTRWLMLLMLVVTLTGNFGMAPMDLLYFDPEKVLKFQVSQWVSESSRPRNCPRLAASLLAVLPRARHAPPWPTALLIHGRWRAVRASGQIWRCVTNFFFLGPLGFGFLMHMMILCVSLPVPLLPAARARAMPHRLCLHRKQHCTQLEANSFSTPADFLVMLIVCGAALLVMGAFMGMPFLGMGLVFAIVYVWAKENADQEVNFVMNLAKFKAFYLPWAYVGLAMLMGQSPVAHLMGIAAGHFYVFLDKIVPVQYNRTVLWTPTFL